jgi:hypothetical protein
MSIFAMRVVDNHSCPVALTIAVNIAKLAELLR